MEEKAVSRRQFLTGIGVGTAALGLSVINSACNERKAARLTDDKELYPIYDGTKYIAKDFSHLTKNSKLGLSSEILNHHLGLYKKYVEKVNQSEAAMAKNQIDDFSLKNLAFSLNGMALHDIYFSNMSTEKSSRSFALNQAIENTFGSYETYYKNLVDLAMKVEGWSITGLNLLNGKIFNYAQDTHSSNFPNYIMPILVLDVYDHAYVLDYGEEGKAEYINVWTKAIDWDLVSRRFDAVKSL